MMAAAPAVDRSVLAGRIQGFGNVNPPPLEDETGTVVAKRAVGRLGDMIGEEVMLTVEDFREKGAVGAVKDAVADAGDIIIDGVSGLVGWIRGDPIMDEENSAAAEFAQNALSNGPTGAAYGVSQASPTGGINAVWVMPEDADPAALASLSQQAGGLMAQQNDPRVPKNIQPYQPPPSSNNFTSSSTSSPIQIPGGLTIAPYEPASGGITIAPYEPAPSGPYGSTRAQPSTPFAGQAALQQSRWGPSGYSSNTGGGSSGSSSGAGSAGASSAASKAFVERIVKGEVLVGPDAAKRLASQCMANKTSPEQLGELVCERIRSLYLGLDGGDPADADEALTRLLGLADALSAMGTGFTTAVVKEIREGALEELSSLRSSAKHKDIAEPMLQRLTGQAQPAITDLLDGVGAATASSASATQSAEADLLGAPEPAEVTVPQEVDLLGGSLGGSTAEAAEADLLGSGTDFASSVGDMASLDPMLSTAVTEPQKTSTGSSLLAGLTLESSVEPAPDATDRPRTTGVMGTGSSLNAADAAGAAALDALVAESSKKEKSNAFDFVGGELSKAQSQA